MRAAGELPADAEVQVPVERARDATHGDFASPAALGLARVARRKPRDIAQQIVDRLPASDLVRQVEIAGPGFVNFFLSDGAYQSVVRQIIGEGDAYGRCTAGAGQRIQVEFVSANPTGPLHVGHGRGAAYGDTVANLLEAAGYGVQREYYVNDAGRQMDILALSVWLRYAELCGREVRFLENAYQGDYIWDIAADLHRAEAEGYLFDGPTGDAEVGDPEARLDAGIAAMKAGLGAERARRVLDLALDVLVGDIRDDLGGFGVRYDEWFPERSLVESGQVERSVEALRERGHLYERDGALWFRSTEFGDEKDRVLVRENGQATYFASDVAYHVNKLERGFDRVINVWGADHHGYVPRVRAALEALGHDPARLDVLLVQFANLYRGGEKVAMSTRSGEFVTLRQLRKEVGSDAARFFYVMRKSEQHMDFDLDLAVSQSNDNPVYYVQYAHARICSVMAQLAERGQRWDGLTADTDLARLTEDHEAALLRRLDRYPEVVEAAALAQEPHQVSFYLRDLANDFHTYYNAHTFLVDDHGLRDARLALIEATRRVLANGLGLLGVSAPESM